MLKKAILIVLSFTLSPSFANADGIGFFGWTNIYYDSPIWSTDGSKIYFIKNVEHSGPSFAFAGPSITVRKYECYIMSMRPDGSGKRTITKFITKKGSLKYMRNLAILPDEQALIFYMLSSNEERGEESGIYKITIKDRKIVNLVIEDQEFSCCDFYVSPDGKKIAYVRNYDKKNPNISHPLAWLIDIDGKNDYLICKEESYVAGWTVDDKVIISKYGEHSYDVYDPVLNSIIKKVNTQGLDDKELAKSLNIIKKTDVSPNGKKKIFREGNSLGVMDIDGKNKVLLKGKIRY